jgi:predicted Zn-dependent protease with MMP-like domain
VAIRRRGSQARRHLARRVNLPPARHAPFEELVERALASLPEAAQRLLDNVAIVIEDEPLDPAEDLYGLYEGIALTEYAADWVPFPNKITLFRLPLEEDFPDPLELEEEVRITVIHELAHHLGIDEDRLEELGYE